MTNSDEAALVGEGNAASDDGVATDSVAVGASSPAAEVAAIKDAPATITDFVTVLTSEEDDEAVAVAAVAPPMAPALTGATFETTKRMGGDTEPLVATWVVGDMSSASDDLRARLEAPDGSDKTLMGTGFAALPPAGSASTG